MSETSSFSGSPKKNRNRKVPPEKNGKGKKQKGPKQAKKKPAHYGCLDNNEIETPDNLLKAIRDEFGEFFDPCPFVGRGKVPDFDGTTVEWGKVNYVNPPYNNVEPWCVKAIDEGRKGKTSVMLVPVRTGTRYWQNYVYPFADQLRFLSGKIIFKGYKKPSPHHLVIVVYRPNYRITQSPPPMQTPDYGDVFDPQKMISDRGAQWRYPELSVICSAQHKAVAGQHSDPDIVAYRNKWMKRRLSLTQLIRPADEVTPNDILYQVCLPLFYQMCCYERQQRDSGISLSTLFSSLAESDLKKQVPLVVLLRQFKPLLMCNLQLRETLFRRHSILPSHSGDISFHIGIDVMTADWYKDAVGFYKAYVDNARLTRAQLTRSYFSIPSDDGEFEQHVMYL